MAWIGTDTPVYKGVVGRNDRKIAARRIGCAKMIVSRGVGLMLSRVPPSEGKRRGKQNHS